MNHVRYAAEMSLPPCPRCGAWRGDPCRTPGDRTTFPHKERPPAGAAGYFTRATTTKEAGRKGGNAGTKAQAKARRENIAKARAAVSPTKRKKIARAAALARWSQPRKGDC